jgi:hypothetical protein
LDLTILAGFRAIFVDAIDARFGDTEHAVDSVVVAHGECDFFRRPKPREKPELLVVAVGFAPVGLSPMSSLRRSFVRLRFPTWSTCDRSSFPSLHCTTWRSPV